MPIVREFAHDNYRLVSSKHLRKRLVHAFVRIAGILYSHK